MMDPAGSVAGVLDWELCTLGDPMADLAGLMGYWYREGEPDPKGDAATTTLDGFLPQEELAGLYAEEMGVSLDKVAYYRAFASWRLACIGEGVYARYLNGQQGEQNEAFDLASKCRIVGAAFKRPFEGVRELDLDVPGPLFPASSKGARRTRKEFDLPCWIDRETHP